MVFMSQPGTPSTTTRGPRPAERDDTPRICMDADWLGSPTLLLSIVSDDTLPCRSMAASVVATLLRSSADTWLMAEVISLRFMVP